MSTKVSKLVTKFMEEYIKSAEFENKDELLKGLKSDDVKKKIDEFTTINEIRAKKTQRDRNLPKRPDSAFLLFSNDKRSLVKEQNPKIEPKSVMKKLGEMWKEISAEERKKYDDIAREKKLAYDEQVSEVKKDEPQKPKTAFYFYKQSKLDEVNRLNPGITKKDSHKKIQTMWKELKSEKCETVKRFESMAKPEPAPVPEPEVEDIPVIEEEEEPLLTPPPQKKKVKKVKKNKASVIDDDE